MVVTRLTRNQLTGNTVRGFESLHLRQKEVTFVYQKLLLFYPSRRLGISSRVSVYIIAAGAYHQPKAVFPAA